METALQIISIVLCVSAFWVGIKKLTPSKIFHTTATLLDVAILIAGTVKLGWLGLGIVVGCNLLAILIYGGSLYIKKDSLLTDAAIQGNIAKDEIEFLYSTLPQLNKVFKFLSPIDRARMIALLCERNRSVREIESMITPIALIWFAQKISMDSLVPKFDQLLRLYRKAASESMEIADMLTSSTQHSAATFEEMLNAMIAAKMP